MDRQQLQTLLGHLESAVMLCALVSERSKDRGYNPAQRAAGLQSLVRKQILDAVCGGKRAEDTPPPTPAKQDATERHSMPNCPACGDTGSYFCGKKHVKTCPQCCTHSEGWYELRVHQKGYIEGEDNRCCMNGCGTLARDLTPENQRKTTLLQGFDIDKDAAAYIASDAFMVVNDASMDDILSILEDEKGQPEQPEQPEFEIHVTDGEARALWLASGGTLHGPKIEHGSITEENLLPLLKRMIVQARALELIQVKCRQCTDERTYLGHIAHKALKTSPINNDGLVKIDLVEELKAIKQIAKEVCRWDWSGNSEEAISCIDALREAIT